MGVNVITGEGSTGTRTPYSREWLQPDPAAGALWTAGTHNVAGIRLYKVIYAGGQYVAVGGNTAGNAPVVLTSPDGIVWTQSTSGVSGSYPLFGIAYGNGTYVATFHLGATCLTSTDAITWTTRSTAGSGTSQWESIIWFNTKFVALDAAGASATGACMTSPDGITWTPRNMADNITWSGLATDGTYIVACGGGTRSGGVTAGTVGGVTTDGISWSTTTLNASNASTAVAYNPANSTWLITASSGISQKSTDRSTWSNASGGNWSDAVCDGTRFILLATGSSAAPGIGATGANPTITTMTLASNWASVAVGPTNAVAVSSAAGGITTTQVSPIDTNSWTCPNSVYTVTALAAGGGGAGGAGASFSGGGGGGGQVVSKALTVTPGTTYAITIGTGGVGGSGAGGTGVATTLGALLTAAGGGGGGTGSGALGSAGANSGGGGGPGSTTTSIGGGGGSGAGGPGNRDEIATSGYIGNSFFVQGLAGTYTGPGSGNTGGASGSSSYAPSSGGRGGPGLYGLGGGGGGGCNGGPGGGTCGGGSGGSNAIGSNAAANSGGGGGGGNAANNGGNGGSGYLRLDWWQ